MEKVISVKKLQELLRDLSYNFRAQIVNDHKSYSLGVEDQIRKIVHDEFYLNNTELIKYFCSELSFRIEECAATKHQCYLCIDGNDIKDDESGL